MEGKKKGEAEKDSVPHVSHKDLEMAEKVSKYNVSGCTSFFTSLKCSRLAEYAFLFTLSSGLKFLYMSLIIRILNVRSL